MNNKPDMQGAGGVENGRARTTGLRNGEKKYRASFLLVDFLLLIGVVSVVFLLVMAFSPLDIFGNDTEPRRIVYTLEFYGVDKDMEYAFREGDTVTDAQSGAVMGVITQVSSRVHETYTDIPTEDIVPEFDKYVVQKERNEEWRVITVSIQVSADYQPGVGYSVNSHRIAVGREYQLCFPSYIDSGACVSLTVLEEGEVS